MLPDTGHKVFRWARVRFGPDVAGPAGTSQGPLNLRRDSPACEVTTRPARTPPAWNADENGGNVDNLVRMAYRALLDRPADSGGFRTYVDLTWQRGFASTLMNIMSSAEYRGRQDRYCAGCSSANVNIKNRDGSYAVARGLTDVASSTAKSCAVSTVTELILQIWRPGYVPLKIAEAAFKEAEKHAWKGKACAATRDFLEAASYGMEVADSGYYVFGGLGSGQRASGRPERARRS